MNKEYVQSCKIENPMDCHYFGCILAQEGYCKRLQELLREKQK